MFLLDPRSATPPFEQLRVQVIDLIRQGELRAGDKLPTVRRLAQDLGLAPNTVARTYRELERDELIETRGRHGTFVAATGDDTQKKLQLAAAIYAERSRSLGTQPAEALATVQAALGIR